MEVDAGSGWGVALSSSVFGKLASRVAGEDGESAMEGADFVEVENGDREIVF